MLCRPRHRPSIPTMSLDWQISSMTGHAHEVMSSDRTVDVGDCPPWRMIHGTCQLPWMVSPFSHSGLGPSSKVGTLSLAGAWALPFFLIAVSMNCSNACRHPGQHFGRKHLAQQHDSRAPPLVSDGSGSAIAREGQIRPVAQHLGMLGNHLMEIGHLATLAAFDLEDTPLDCTSLRIARRAPPLLRRRRASVALAPGSRCAAIHGRASRIASSKRHGGLITAKPQAARRPCSMPSTLSSRINGLNEARSAANAAAALSLIGYQTA